MKTYIGVNFVTSRVFNASLDYRRLTDEAIFNYFDVPIREDSIFWDKKKRYKLCNCASKWTIFEKNRILMSILRRFYLTFTIDYLIILTGTFFKFQFLN